jgi:hypothetical protein
VVTEGVVPKGAGRAQSDGDVGQFDSRVVDDEVVEVVGGVPRG